ncbi:hypothetical protein SAE02_32800 [Skermanella aerolata]|uniref:DUF2249 domain-containing protein n=1 Tax=Skermanella aerolata TaxID=393310 RepID=A0A512DRL9_9PROT|nr:DUF2249 domain-containing protein [Skermanella aerolata]KJB93177.1 hypothetical protein N826_16575 [Skermanella aerolata KACC 11604]GEO39132.1 hypothetical protein SAE02_32800 [Skermanella aerolata]
MSLTPHTLVTDTLLVDVIAGDAEAIHRLIALNPVFAVLLDPDHRNAMVGQIRLGEAARVAEVPFDSLCAVLKGKPVETAGNQPVVPAAATPSDWFEQAESQSAPHLDVRPLLASGQDPFAQVMSASAKVPSGGFLVVDAPFDPAPLRRVLAGKGFTSLGRQMGPGHWRICWRREEPAPVEVEESPMPARGPEPWKADDGTHIDVRGLQPPEPMTRVLDLIDQGGFDNLVLHHDREPVLLYPMLAERGWSCLSAENLEGEVRIRLARESS